MLYRPILTSRRHLLLQVGAGLSAIHAKAQAALPLQVLAAEVPPYSDATGGWLDVRVNVLARIAHFQGNVQHLPWARALMQARERGRALVYPLARVPEQELEWRWLALLTMDELVLWVRRDAIGASDLQDPAAVRRLRIGSTRAGLHSARLSSQGFANTELATHEAANARKLGLGRVQGWAVTRAAGEYLLQRERVDRRLLHAPMQLGTVPLYLAATRDVPDFQIAAWKRALREISPETCA